MQSKHTAKQNTCTDKISVKRDPRLEASSLAFTASKPLKNCTMLEKLYYLKRSVEFQPLKIVGHQLEIVKFHKVLGPIIQNNLQWDAHIRSIIAKAS